ncbi:hypothetical protein J4470_02000 [Candidatus Woesearchaeota archaeon]|nr:hypothetical protein [Candidatus Woesearchaeota archaeon]
MSEGTYFGVELKKGTITSNEALVDTFMKYLGCFDNPHVWEVYLNKVGEEGLSKAHKLGDTSNHIYANLPRKAVYDFLKKTIAHNPGVEFGGIRSYGAGLFDADKYGFPADSIMVARNGLGWQGLSPEHYGIDPKKYYDGSGIRTFSVSEQGKKEWNIVVPLIDVQKMIFSTLKRIIQAFDPVSLNFRREYSERLHGSQVLYFKDPYLFCFDLEPNEDINDEGVLRKLKEIKSVLSLEELERILKEQTERSDAEVWKSSFAGAGVFEKFERKSTSIFSGNLNVIIALRRAVREKGVDLPEGDVEDWARYEEEYFREKKKK